MERAVFAATDKSIFALDKRAQQRQGLALGPGPGLGLGLGLALGPSMLDCGLCSLSKTKCLA